MEPTKVAARSYLMDHPWTPKDDENLLALRAAGLKWQMIAKKLGRTEAATISRAGVLKKLAEDGRRG